MEMPELPQKMKEKRIKKLTGGNVPELIYYVRPVDYFLWDVPVTKAMRNLLLKGAPASLRSSLVAFFCRPELTTGEAVTKGGVK